MATLLELARARTDLGFAATAHLQRLVASWGMLSDLCFADLLLLAPATVVGGRQRFVVLGQIRPTTSQTLHREDLVGQEIEEVDRPLVARAWRSGEIFDGEVEVSRGERARMQCIPVRWQGEVLGVLTRESALLVGRRQGELERVYVETFDRFARMIVNGEFPYAGDEPTGDLPRVGDGVLVLDATMRVEYSSPNAVNALHRMGIYSNTEGSTLGELGFEDSGVRAAYESATPVTEEVERRPDVIVTTRCIPLLDHGQVTGALVLLRDITDLRRRDRLLVSLDATIREVHHRVKNNLQTISSILRLQARRAGSTEARLALDEASRRIRSIALVHEILSREPADQVAFNEIVQPLVRMAEEGVVGERPVRFTVDGDAGELPADIATPLAVVLTELLQNAAEHAFPDDPTADPAADVTECRVDVWLHSSPEEVVVNVRDNGIGLPEGFTIDGSPSLGLSIVRSLVTTQLGGTIEMSSDAGTVVELRIPAPTTTRSR